MDMKKVLVCDGTIDGIFTAIYRAWEFRFGHDNTKLIEENSANNCETLELFAEYITIDTDYDLSNKVATTIRKKISSEAYEYVVKAALSCQTGRADAIYRFLILGFYVGSSVMDHLSHPAVNQVFSMSRNVSNETHHFLGFLRFQEVSNGLLLSVIRPKNDILSLIAPHFSDRLSNENFLIFDEGRNIAIIHRCQEEAFLMEVDETIISSMNYVKSDELEYEQLWKAFYKSVSIQERENIKLQKNNLPLRFRNNMTEFHS